MMIKEEIKSEVDRICSQYMCPMTKEPCYGSMCVCLYTFEHEQHFAMNNIPNKLITYVGCVNHSLVGDWEHVDQYIELGRIEEDLLSDENYSTRTSY